MNKSFVHNKEKKFYSSKLFSIAPNIYDTYKRMKKSRLNSLSNQNTSQASLETISITKHSDINTINKTNTSKDNKNYTISHNSNHNNTNKKKKNTFIIY